MRSTTPSVRFKLTALRSSVAYSTDWASQVLPFKTFLFFCVFFFSLGCHHRLEQLPGNLEKLTLISVNV